MLVNKKKILAFGLLLGIVLSGVSGFVLLGFATPPAWTEVTIIGWTYFDQPNHEANAYFNLHLEWETDGKTVREWVPAFCLDSRIFWSTEIETRVVVPSDYPNLPSYIDNEELKIVNYIMFLWHNDQWPSATWREIQHAIWHYSDYNDPPGSTGQVPSCNPTIVNQIITYIDTHGADLEAWTGPYTVMVLDPGDGENDQRNIQLTFFEIPEVAFGTITSLMAMAGGFLSRKKHT